MSFIGNIFGGSKSQAPAATPASQTQYVREAPGIEERKLELMDLARSVAGQPVALPAVQAAPLSGLEQQGMTLAGTTGVGQPTATAGIGQLLASQTPNINQFLNPFQSYVIDEINRQAQMGQNQIAAQAVQSGAFGGGREGVQQAELDRRRLETIGRAQQQGFGTALGAAQRQQVLQQQAGQNLLAAGQAQQGMAQGDIQQLLGAGGVQRQLAQQALDAQRATTLQQQFEPFQRAEFLANLYAAGPKSQSGITATTTPGTSPLAQSIGTGLGAFAAYQGANQ